MGYEIWLSVDTEGAGYGVRAVNQRKETPWKASVLRAVGHFSRRQLECESKGSFVRFNQQTQGAGTAVTEATPRAVTS